MKVFTFIDSLLVDQPSDQAIRSDAIGIVNQGKSPKLKVSIDATHSGVLTNRRVYPGTKMQDGYKSFFSKANGGTAEFNKPVLKHHSSYDDAVGRVTGATFTALKQGKAFMEDYLAPDAEGGKGSGVVTLDALITDPDTIQKIIDGRYLSVSVGHNTDSVTCSICGKNIFKCLHMPGKSYDADGEETDEDAGFLCFYITGNMTYNEVSFVNMPAQPPAKLLNFKWEDCNKAEEFNKSNILIESMVRGKKSVVRAFTLQDADGEYNLLNGKSMATNKKVVVAMTAQKSTSSEETQEADENNNVHQHNPDDSKEGLSKGAVKTDKLLPNKEHKMDPNTQNGKDKQQVDPAVLTASLEALTNERTALTKSIEDSKAKIATLEKTIETKTSEIERLTKAQTDSQVEMSKVLASALTAVKVQLKKPDITGLDSADKMKEFSANLAKRSVESLKDSLADLVLELANEKAPAAESEGSKKINGMLSDEKVVTPLATDNKNNVQAGSKKAVKTTDGLKKPVDQAFEN